MHLFSSCTLGDEGGEGGGNAGSGTPLFPQFYPLTTVQEAVAELEIGGGKSSQLSEIMRRGWRQQHTRKQQDNVGHRVPPPPKPLALCPSLLPVVKGSTGLMAGPVPDENAPRP